MRIRSIVLSLTLLMLVLGLMSACTDLSTPLSPTVAARSSNTVCPKSGPAPPGCPQQPPPYTALAHDINVETIPVGPGYTATGSEPLWSGEQVESIAAGYECPTSAVWPWVQVEHPTDGTISFIITGVFQLIRTDGTSNGFPKGVYQFPSGTFPSVFPTGYTLTGGSLIGECHYKVVRKMLPGATSYSWIGYMKWLTVTNAIFGSGAAVPSVTSRGYAYGVGASILDSFARGDNYYGGGGQSGQSVYKKAHDTGECTPGWEIWIDNAQVCDAYGNLVG